VIGSSPVQALVEEIGRAATAGFRDPKTVAEACQRFNSELRPLASS